MSESIHPGDIVRTRWPQQTAEYLSLYLGSGRCGACFDAWGLMNNGGRRQNAGSAGNTVIMHADHWHRGVFGMDFWLPAGRLMWASEPPAEPQRYRQELRIVHGYLLTEMNWAGLKLTQVAHFHPQRRDLLAVHISYEASGKAKVPELLLAPETDIHTHYKQHVSGEAECLEESAGAWHCRVKAGTAESVLALRVISNDGKVILRGQAGGVGISFNGKRGSHLLLIGVAGMQRRRQLLDEMNEIKSAEAYLEESIAAWHQRWGDAEIEIPEAGHQALYERSLYYLLASYAPDVRCPAGPMGWSGNGWPLHLPQDQSFVHPVLLRAGHLDIARSTVEFYASRIENTREYTRRVYKADGAMWPWMLPVGEGSELLKDGTPNWFQYEIHNAAYPARMAHETAQQMNDPQWTRDVAWPVVFESARFYASVLQRDKDGTWGIHVTPSMGQDEIGPKNARNYLCALFSAKYSLQTALQMAAELRIGTPELEQWKTILREGLSFSHLEDARREIYFTCDDPLAAGQFGRQKHPVQLNPLTLLPLGMPDQRVRNAYNIRHQLCAGVRENYYLGWTLSAFALAASHSNDSHGLAHELAQLLPSRSVDKDWIQIYETSGKTSSPYYLASHGLYLQALNDALVSDYFGATEIGSACPAAWGEVNFSNLRTRDGKILSGERVGGRWQVESAQDISEEGEAGEGES